MASSHVYDMTGVGAPPPAVISARRGVTQAQPEREGMVELALDPSELDMDSDAMAVRYEQQMRENQSQLQKEDLSDMLAEHVAKQKVYYQSVNFGFLYVIFFCFFRVRERGNKIWIPNKARNTKSSNFNCILV